MLQCGVDHEFQPGRVPQPQLPGKFSTQEARGAAQAGKLRLGVATGSKRQKIDARGTQILEQRHRGDRQVADARILDGPRYHSAATLHLGGDALMPRIALGHGQVLGCALFNGAHDVVRE